MKLFVFTLFFHFATLVLDVVLGFSSQPHHQTKIPSRTAIHSYDPYQHNDDQYGHDPFSRNKERTDIRNLLTQRSLQSFVHLLNSVRDVHTAKWIEKVLEFKNLDSFHGTGALDMTKYPSWDSVFLELITMDSEAIHVEASLTARQNRRRGWSNKAGYLDNLSTKKQLDDCFQNTSPSERKEKRKKPQQQVVRAFRSGSYLNGLGTKSGDQPTKKKTSKKIPKAPSKHKPIATPKLRSSSANYLEALRNGNAELPPEQKKRKSTAKKNPYLEEKSVRYEIEVDPASLVNRIISVREQLSTEWASDLETLFLTNDEILTSYLDEQMDSRKYEGEESMEDRNSESTFDSSALFFLTNSLDTQDRESSPFRMSNLDLLLLLSTQESIHRVLRGYAKREDKQNFNWLKDFYTTRLGEFFDGHGQAYGRADDFLMQLIASPPVAKRTETDDIIFIDPMKMIEDIVRERSDVAREWKDVTENISRDHTDLRRLLLTRRMLEADDDTSGIPKFPALPKNRKKNSKGDFEEAGVFE